jgi:hypothetical protein
MRLENWVVFALWTLRVLENVEVVVPIPHTAPRVADGVLGIRVHLV